VNGRQTIADAYVELLTAIATKFETDLGYTKGAIPVVEAAAIIANVGTVSGVPGQVELAIDTLWGNFVYVAQTLDGLISSTRNTLKRYGMTIRWASFQTKPKTSPGLWKANNETGFKSGNVANFAGGKKNSDWIKLADTPWDQVVLDLVAFIDAYNERARGVEEGKATVERESSAFVQKLLSVINWVADAVDTLESDSKVPYTTVLVEGRAEPVPFNEVYPIKRVDFPSETPIGTVFEDTENSRENLMEALRYMRKQFKGAVVQCFETTTRLQQESTDQQTEIDTLKESIESLKGQLETLRTEAETAEARGREAERTELGKRIKELETELSRQEGLVTRLRGQKRATDTALEKKEAVNAQLEQSLSDARTEAEGARSRLRESEGNWEAHFQALDARLEEKDAELGRAREERDMATRSTSLLKKAASMLWTQPEVVARISSAVSSAPEFGPQVGVLLSETELLHEGRRPAGTGPLARIGDYVIERLGFEKGVETKASFPSVTLARDIESDELTQWLPGLATAYIALTAALRVIPGVLTERIIQPDTLGLLIQAVPSVFYLLMTCKNPQSFAESSTVIASRVLEGTFDRVSEDFSVRDVLKELLFSSSFADVFNPLVAPEDQLERPQLESDADFASFLDKSIRWPISMENTPKPSQIAEIEAMYSNPEMVDRLNALLRGIALSALVERKLVRRITTERTRKRGPEGVLPRLRRQPRRRSDETKEEGRAPEEEEKEVEIMESSIKGKAETTWDMWLS
jgi:hypothetical protein